MIINTLEGFCYFYCFVRIVSASCATLVIWRCEFSGFGRSNVCKMSPRSEIKYMCTRFNCTPFLPRRYMEWENDDSSKMTSVFTSMVYFAPSMIVVGQWGQFCEISRSHEMLWVVLFIDKFLHYTVDLVEHRRWNCIVLIIQIWFINCSNAGMDDEIHSPKSPIQHRQILQVGLGILQVGLSFIRRNSERNTSRRNASAHRYAGENWSWTSGLIIWFFHQTINVI